MKSGRVLDYQFRPLLEGDKVLGKRNTRLPISAALEEASSCAIIFSVAESAQPSCLRASRKLCSQSLTQRQAQFLCNILSLINQTFLRLYSEMLVQNIL